MAFYGGFSKKQLGVIWWTNNNHNITLTENQINMVMNGLVGSWGLHYNDNEQAIYDNVNWCIQSCFAKDYKMAQEFIINAIKLKCAFYDSKLIELVKNELELRAIVYGEDLDVDSSKEGEK